MKRTTVRITDNTSKVSYRTRELLRSALNEAGQACQEYASANAPVETGELANSIEHEVEDLVMYVGTQVEYAPYVELGTGPHYIRPPKWMQNLAKRGHHKTDPWWYLDEDGDWQLGWFVTSRPYLKPAIQEHISEYRDIIKKYLDLLKTIK